MHNHVLMGYECLRGTGGCENTDERKGTGAHS